MYVTVLTAETGLALTADRKAPSLGLQSPLETSADSRRWDSDQIAPEITLTATAKTDSSLATQVVRPRNMGLTTCHHEVLSATKRVPRRRRARMPFATNSGLPARPLWLSLSESDRAGFAPRSPAGPDVGPSTANGRPPRRPVSERYQHRRWTANVEPSDRSSARLSALCRMATSRLLCAQVQTPGCCSHSRVADVGGG